MLQASKVLKGEQVKKEENYLEVDNQILEEKIFDRLKHNRLFRDITTPCVILEKDKQRLLLGVSRVISTQVGYNFSAKSSFQEAVYSACNSLKPSN